MLRLSRTPLLVGLVAGCCLALTPQPGRSQGANKGAPVQFATSDGVTIKGNFYAAAKRDAACVMMLHALGASEDSNKNGWQELAQALNAKGFAVLTFDFRGHGDSTNINAQEFWSPKISNGQYMPKLLGRDTIEFKDLPKSYYPVLLNDIAAAKAFLDRKNDTGDCNTSSLVLVGAETGATLGAIWAHSEFSRYKVETSAGFAIGQPFPIQQTKLAKDPEGKSTLACVWLSISKSLVPNSTFSLAGQILPVAKTPTEVPMLFLFGSKDPEAEKVAKDLEKGIKGLKKTSKYEFTVTAAVPGGDKKLRGRGLLQGTGVEKEIASYVESVSKDRPREWVEQDFRKSGYVWRFGLNQFTPVKYPGEMTMIYSTYQQFLR